MRALLITITLAALATSSGCESKPLSWTLSAQDLATPDQLEVLNKAASAALSRCEDVLLRFRPGIYRNVRLFIDDRGRQPGCAAKFSIDRAGDSGVVVFQGGQRPKFIDIVTHQATFAGAIRNVEVRDYMNGIAVTRTNSKKGEKVRWAAETAGEKGEGQGLTITNVTFWQVGDWERTDEPSATGWGAVLFNFASGNRVVGNRFEGLGNAVDSPLMHAIYLVGSSRNVITNNYFGAMDGAAIKLRNRSNANRIENNSFRFGGEPLLQLWFCNQSVRGVENCAIDECPSTGTAFAGNRIIVSPTPDRTRRGGGPLAVNHPFVSYEQVQGVKLVERFYVARGVPKSCGRVDSSAPVVTPAAGNLIETGG